MSDLMSDEFSYYRTNVAPIISDLEELCGEKINYDGTTDGFARKTPVLYRYPEIHIELRMAFAHFARALKNGALNGGPLTTNNSKREIVEKELKGAHDHLQRASMDAYKGQYEVLSNRISKEYSEYEYMGIREVGNGNFIKSFDAERRDAKNCYVSGKISEAKGEYDKARIDYDKALSHLRSSDHLFKETEDDLKSARDIFQNDWKKGWPEIVFLAIELIVLVYTLVK